MFDGMTSAQLAEILATVKPVELKGVALLKRRRPSGGKSFPTNISSKALADAAGELMGYQGKCATACENLMNLPPVASASPIEEWPL